MTSTTSNNGRLGNQIIRNLAVSLIAEKNDLYVDYSSKDIIEQLGIDLFSGKKKHSSAVVLNDDNFFEVLNRDSLDTNLDPNNAYFQTKEITNLLYRHLHSELIKSNIISKNPFKDRYNSNNDLCIHIRLTDVANLNPGIDYYLKAISRLVFDNLYLATDDPNHAIIKQIFAKYPSAAVINCNIIQTIQFASTCKHIILSHGSFSAVIGYLAFFSGITYPDYSRCPKWHGDMFSIPGWSYM